MAGEPENMPEVSLPVPGPSGIDPVPPALSVGLPSSYEKEAAQEDANPPDSSPQHGVVGSDPPERVTSTTEAEEDIAEDEVEEEEEVVSSEPLEYYPDPENEDLDFQWYILKVAVNREDSIKANLLRRIKMNGLERYFSDIVIPTEDVKEYTKTGKARVVKHKMYLGYLLVRMVLNDDSWFLVRETSGIGDFTGSGGKPTPMEQKDVDRILKIARPVEETAGHLKTNIPFKHGDRVRVKDGNFQNFEGDVDKIDEANGRVTVLVNIFGRSTPVELEHWQIESV